MNIDLRKALNAAEQSNMARQKLNVMLWMGIPFNFPHRIRIHRVEPDAVTTRIDLRRKNKNHIGGIHACGLATAAEFCSGLALLRVIDPRKYRLIMQKMTVEYHYQAKADAFARFSFPEKRAKSEVLEPLEASDAVLITCEVPVHDASDNHLCTAFTTWQIKPWSKVRTGKK